MAADTGRSSATAPWAIELLHDLGWLIRLRWLAVGALVGGMAAAILLAGVTLPLAPITAALLALVAYNALLLGELDRLRYEAGKGLGTPSLGERVRRAIVLAPSAPLALWPVAVNLGRRIARRPVRVTLESLLVPHALEGGAPWLPPAARLASAQICFDLAALAVLLHLSGGIENPFAYSVVFHVVVSAILLSRRATYLHTGLGLGLVVVVALGEWAGWLGHVPIEVPGWAQGHDSAGFIAAQLTALATTLFLAAFLGSAIAARLRNRERDAAALALQLADKAATLEAAFARLAETERVKSEYMRKVSHELRAPLATVQTALKVVLDGLAGQLPVSSFDVIQRAERRTGELISVTADLLALSRAREAHLELQMTDLDVAALARDALGDAGDAAVRAGVELRAEIDERIGPVRADGIGLKHLLDNLLTNAIRYNRRGGTVVLRLARSGDALRLEVADTGIGIAAADLPRVFEDFYRSTAAKQHCAAGTGLGMAIVKAVIDQHHGTVAIASEPGAGTTVTVEIPAPARSAADRSQAAVASS